MIEYDVIPMVDVCDTDSLVLFHPTKGGEWTKTVDVNDKLGAVKSGLLNLKNCNMHLTTAEQLNEIVGSLINIIDNY